MNQQTLPSQIIIISGALVCAFLLTTGCYSISKQFPISQGKVSAYMNCLKTRGGSCPSDARYSAEQTEVTVRISALQNTLSKSIENELAEQNNSSTLNLWNDPVQKKIVNFYGYLNSRKDPKMFSVEVKGDASVGTIETYPLEFSADELHNYHARIQESVQSNGWDILEVAAERALNNLELEKRNIPSGNDSESKARQEQIDKIDKDIKQAKTAKRVATYIKAYLAAYFRNGEFFKVSVNTDLAQLKARLEKVLRDRFPQLNDEAITKLVVKAVEELQGKLYFGDIGTTGFVTRSGDTYQFPALEARLDPLAKRTLTVSKIDFAVVGADLVRLILEGTFDAVSGLPAVSNATGFKNIPAPDGLSVHDPATSAVDETEFGKVSSFGGQTEAASSTAFGQLIRGAGWVSLNNEYLGKVLETLVGVTVRKIMEQCAWCYYACKINETNPLSPKDKTIVKVTVSGLGLF